MESVLAGLCWLTCLVYIDDIIVFSDTFEKHVENLTSVLQRMRQAHLKLNPKKCDLRKGSFLGHVVSEDG